MNGMMPSRDRQVEGIANHSRRRTPPGGSPAARMAGGERKSRFDRVGALPVHRLGRRHCHPHLLPDGARQESAHGMGLPSCRFQQLLHAGSLRAFHQVQDFRCLAAIAGRACLSAALWRFLGGPGFGVRLGLVGRNVRALSGHTSPFAGISPSRRQSLGPCGLQ